MARELNLKTQADEAEAAVPLLMEVLRGSRGAGSGQQQPSHASSAKSLSLSSVSSWPLGFAVYVWSGVCVGRYVWGYMPTKLVKNIFGESQVFLFCCWCGRVGSQRTAPGLSHLWQHTYIGSCVSVCIFNCYCQLTSPSVTCLQWISNVKGEPKLRSMMVPVSQKQI